MNFSERLKKAAERGARARADKAWEQAAKAMSDEECRRRHSSLRMALCEHIEKCMGQLADNFPGFKIETIVEDRGWGTGVSRDDHVATGRKRQNLFSRLQVVVGSYNSDYKVLSVDAKGTVRNKETFTRSHFEPIGEADEDNFRELVELWVLDYAEQYAG